jgi:lipopolysaccharide transport system ATP-binding protein
VRLYQNGKAIHGIVDNGQHLELQVIYKVYERTVGLRVYFDVMDGEDSLLFRSFNDEEAEGIPLVHPGTYMARAIIPMNLLGPIRYTIGVGAGIHNVRSCLPDRAVRISFDVYHTSPYNRAYAADSFRGKLAPVIAWECGTFAGHDA